MVIALAGGLPGVGRSRAQQLARRELARPMYQPSLAARLWHDLENWLSSLTGTTVSGNAGWVGPILVLLLIGAILVLLLYLAGPARLNRRLRAGPVLQGSPMTAAGHRAAADRLAAAGDYQSAIVERVRAIATDLETRQILPPRPGRTAAELAAEAGRAIPAEAAPLASVAGLFDDVRYGGRRGSERGYLLARDLDLRLQTVPVLAGAAPGAGEYRERAW